MRVAMVCFNLSWQAGGVRLIYSFAHALKKIGHTVVIYAPEMNESAYPDLRMGLDIRIVPPSLPIVWQYSSDGIFRRIVEKLARGKALASAGRKIVDKMDPDFDLVNLHDFSYQIAPLYKRKNPRARIIWTMNDPPYLYLPKDRVMYDLLSRAFNLYKDFAERRYFRFIDGVAVLMNRNKVWAKERGMKADVVWSGLE
ncbi:MAG: glycosyltransferase, partial [Patescibacteria group bacterium]